MKIAATGLSGLIGSRVRELLQEKHEFIPIGLSAGVNITNQDDVASAVRGSDADFIINFAGKADVDGSEEEKDMGEDSEAWKINVVGAANIARASHSANKKLIHISTDFVFDGEKEYYSEDDIPTEATCWYGQTKLEGERAVRESGVDFVMVRIAYPYRHDFQKKDFVRAMYGRLKQGGQIAGVTDHIMTPTFIDDIALALDRLMAENASGTYHIVGSEFISPYEAALKICDNFGFDRSLVSQTTREEYFSGKAKRPFRLCLKNDKIIRLGVKMSRFSEGLKILAERGL